MKLKGRPADVVSWTPINNAPKPTAAGDSSFDESARSYLALQIPGLEEVHRSAAGVDAAVAVAYMTNGRAVMAQTLTTDHALAADSLRMTNRHSRHHGQPLFLPVRPGEALAFAGKISSRGLYGDQWRGSVLQIARYAGSISRGRNSRCSKEPTSGVFDLLSRTPWRRTERLQHSYWPKLSARLPTKPAANFTAWPCRVRFPLSRS